MHDTQGGFATSELNEARQQFYPGWWTHGLVPPDAANAPRYRVVCETESELQLAMAAKPDNIRVDIVLTGH